MTLHGKWRRVSAIGVCAALALACQKKPVEPVAASSPAVEKESSADERESVAITVYNQNFGLVREVRSVSLGTGKVSLEYRDVSAHIQPETVHIKSLGDPSALEVLEQNYRYDLLTPKKLLEKYVGKKVAVYRFNEKLGTDERFEAKVLAVENGVVLEINGEVTTQFPGRFAFPEVPENLISKPSLVWLLKSKNPNQRVEVKYLTQNLNWRADYVLVIDAKDELGDLTGWVTLSNTSGASYENATLKLVAGDVQRVVANLRTEEQYEYSADEDSSGGDSFVEEGFFEYHLYTLQRPTTLLDKEQKQVSLLSAQGIRVEKKLIFRGAKHYYRSRYGQVVSNQKVGVFLDIQNKSDNRLGIPLPKGTVRVYKADKSGAQQFIGEDSIDHTPRDEEVRVKMGEAFDVVADRKQMKWTAISGCQSESTWEISLRNHKDVAEVVEVVEPAPGDWEILDSSHPAKKEDAHTFVFEVKVPANGEEKITYRVRVRWC